MVLQGGFPTSHTKHKKDSICGTQAILTNCTPQRAPPTRRLKNVPRSVCQRRLIDSERHLSRIYSRILPGLTSLMFSVPTAPCCSKRKPRTRVVDIRAFSGWGEPRFTQIPGKTTIPSRLHTWHGASEKKDHKKTTHVAIIELWGLQSVHKFTTSFPSGPSSKPAQLVPSVQPTPAQLWFLAPLLAQEIHADFFARQCSRRQ